VLKKPGLGSHRPWRERPGQGSRINSFRNMSEWIGLHPWTLQSVCVLCVICGSIPYLLPAQACGFVDASKTPRQDRSNSDGTLVVAVRLGPEVDE
jgi:hypothetical protein